MRPKFDKIKKANRVPKKKDQAPTEADIEVYRQINKTSFQQNFKALLGHYKNYEHVSQASRVP